MYVYERGGLGGGPLSKPERLSPGPRLRPPYLRPLSLDSFDTDKASLTPYHMLILDALAKTVAASWNTSQPIRVIRLIGHTDDTGPEKYNEDLGNRRARTVEETLKDKLRGFLDRVLIVVEPSPGETDPTADNRSSKGRERNRRVEVFITTDNAPAVRPPTPDPPPSTDWREQAEKAAERAEDERQRREEGRRFNQPVPTLPPGKSVSERLDELLERLPKWLARKIRDAVLSGACAALEALFLQAGGRLRESDKEDLRKRCLGAAKRRAGSPQTSGRLGQPVPVACNPDPGEVAASRTAAGILPKDVEVTDRGVLVRDFGIDRRSVKGRARSELASFIRRLETDPAITEIRIHGFSDCIGPGGARYHTWLRSERALRVRDLLGPVARSKVKFVGPAPIGTFMGPNTDKVGRARNRSVLIEFVSNITFEPEPPITAPPCHEQLIRRALRQLRDDGHLDSKVKTRLDAALGTSLAGRDDSFIRPGSTSWMFPFRWSGIAQYFRELCNRPGGAAALSASRLAVKLMELDQDIINGLDAFKRARQKFSSIFDKKALLEANFGRRLEALLKNKAQTVYAEY